MKKKKWPIVVIVIAVIVIIGAAAGGRTDMYLWVVSLRLPIIQKMRLM